MIVRTWLLGSDARRERDSYLWNSIAGLINAMQSTIILFVLQRISTTEISGVFTIAFALANLMQNIGRYGVRYFQASDLNDKYSFGNYVSHRIVTSGFMMIASVLYCLFQLIFGGYSTEKALICLLFCVQKLPDCLEDAYYGEYQRRGRLDTAGRTMSVRLVIVTLSFVLFFWLTASLAVAALVSTLFGALFLVFSLRSLSGAFGVPDVSLSSPAVRGLLKDCFPLFAGAFLLIFVINVPKFSIDAILTSEQQAVYGFVSLPILVVSLLAEFVFRPMTTKLTEDWSEGRLVPFRKRIFLIIAIIAGITAVCVVGGLIIGVPILTILFKYPMRTQRLPLAILLFGSGVLSVTSFLGMILTIFRRQKCVVLSYIPSAVISIPVSALLVRRYELVGAAVSYLILVSVMCLAVAAFVVHTIRSRKRSLTS